MSVILKNTVYRTVPDGLTLWMDGADESRITLNGSTVNQWDDKSGKDLNISQSQVTKQPLYVYNELNGRNVVRFDGVDDTLVRSNVLGSQLFTANETTIFSVHKHDALQNSFIFSWYPTLQADRVSYHAPYLSDNYVYWDAPLTDGRIGQTGHGGKIDWAVWAFVKESDTSSRVYYNGTSLFSGSYPSSPINIADSGDLELSRFQLHLKGDVAEVMVFNKVLSAGDFNAQYNRLKNKWGL